MENGKNWGCQNSKTSEPIDKNHPASEKIKAIDPHRASRQISEVLLSCGFLIFLFVTSRDQTAKLISMQFDSYDTNTRLLHS